MGENMEQRPVQGARFELPVSAEAKAAGVTGAIVKKRGPGLLGETGSGAVMKALFRADRSQQVSRDAAERATNTQFGLGYVTDSERAQLEAIKQQRKQAPAAEQGSGGGNTQLMEADRQQTERALDATRSALKSEVAAQADAARPQPLDGNEGTTRPAEGKAQEPDPQQETEQLTMVDRKSGRKTILTVPKNYTSEDI